MEQEQSEAVALGALLHDIGKFMQRAGLPLSQQSKNMENTICPVFRGRYSHRHVLWTNEFFDNYFPKDRIDRSQDNVANLASYHHRPSTPLQTIIQEADRLSAGMDRKTYTKVAEEEISKRGHIVERLAPVFEEICLAKNIFEGFHFRYPLKPLSPPYMFPEKTEDVVDLQQTKSVFEYSQLWEAFRDECRSLSKLKPLTLFPDSLLFLLERFTWAIPSATYSLGRQTWTDISLYDHSVTTSAIALALYLYHKSTDSMTEEAIRDREKKKFIFVNLDVSGIQRFIFDIAVDSTRGAARILRARSFYLALLMEGAARCVFKEFGLFSPSRVISAGGRAVIVAPLLEAAERKIETIQHEIDRFLWSNYFGELTINLSWIPVSGKELELDCFPACLEALTQSAQRAKLRKMSSMIGNPENHRFDAFWKEYEPDKGICRACGKKQAKVPVREARL
ncbi:MAG: type III-A CRISPR-associated protein Cas10/Csm1 [Deltaproteobacteria bacterium]|nr:type III-A CRISPR-associated protein Cas10/Csm1 [Deltaproteobacteria bacterium]